MPCLYNLSCGKEGNGKGGTGCVLRGGLGGGTGFRWKLETVFLMGKRFVRYFSSRPPEGTPYRVRFGPFITGENSFPREY